VYSSFLTDGASAILIMSEEKALELGMVGFMYFITCNVIEAVTHASRCSLNVALTD